MAVARDNEVLELNSRCIPTNANLPIGCIPACSEIGNVILASLSTGSITRSWLCYRFLALCCLFAIGAIIPIISALLLAREKRLWRHEGLKANCFICTIIAGMVGSNSLSTSHSCASVAQCLSLPAQDCGIHLLQGHIPFNVTLPNCFMSALMDTGRTQRQLLVVHQPCIWQYLRCLWCAGDGHHA